MKLNSFSVQCGLWGGGPVTVLSLTALLRHMWQYEEASANETKNLFGKKFREHVLLKRTSLWYTPTMSLSLSLTHTHTHSDRVLRNVCPWSFCCWYQWTHSHFMYVSDVHPPTHTHTHTHTHAPTPTHTHTHTHAYVRTETHTHTPTDT